jgi:hypothetical protein
MKAWTMRALVTVVFAGLISVGAGADDDNGLGQRSQCDEGTLRGSYVLTARGFSIVGGVAQPKAIVELIDFHGDGALTVTGGTVSNNGAITQIPPNGAGNYTVGPDCNGTLSFIPFPNFSLFVERDGKRGWVIQTNTGHVFQGTLEQRK